MRQVMFSSSRAFVARMPRPTPDAGCVLVRTHFSLISTGTELAALRPLFAVHAGQSTAERVSELTTRAHYYLGKAVKNPRLAIGRAVSIARNSVNRRLAEVMPKPSDAPVYVGPVEWTQEVATEFEVKDGQLTVISGGEPGHYQAASQAMTVPPNYLVEVRLKGQVHKGSFMLGLLNEDKTSWLGVLPLGEGALDEKCHFDPGQARTVTLMLSNGSSPGENRMMLTEATVTMVPAESAGLPVTEMIDQGWNLGYSLAGTVVALGPGITDLAVGDRVACAGAGQANHADFVSVKRNLVCRIPDGCPLEHAATSTVGAIALQGVRRANLALGEVVCVIGLGLIGLITVQLLRANGCRVIGHDLDPERCKRAKALGAVAAERDVERVQQVVRDLTDDHGVDASLITAATRSSGPINTAMELTRRRGKVVIVGDIGMKVERTAFYRKEIDLLMSTSYGPGRYDREYEDFGRDYPYAYVRWTTNRNMRSYMELIADKRIDVASLIDRVVPIDEAPAAYASLASANASPPIGVLIGYESEPRVLLDRADSPVIHLRGYKRPLQGRITYALVGAGGFGTQMLVPIMDKCKDRFFLRAVVSRDATRGGNFARSRQVEIFSSDYDAILEDNGINLVVLATRHNEHAAQVIRALEAGKHVFVEKPLAISWDQLDAVRDKMAELDDPPRLMVGFNRRFSPALLMLKQELGSQRTPLMVNYRLNAGYISLDHWVHGAEGGGRNIGEACHMYDCFAFLADAPVASISATAIDPGDRPYNRNDNFCATVHYEDGSVCTLTYVALGPKAGLPKERIEVFANGEAWVVDDFKSLTRASDSAVLWSAAASDKGHFKELSRFGDSIASGEPSPIPLQQIFETSAVALHVEDLLYGRAGEAPL
jgi:predicted dehydrogenase/threonine dehydrogenase-like Zn-dependent dehydrogenase